MKLHTYTQAGWVIVMHRIDGFVTMVPRPGDPRGPYLTAPNGGNLIAEDAAEIAFFEDFAAAEIAREQWQAWTWQRRPTASRGRHG